MRTFNRKKKSLSSTKYYNNQQYINWKQQHTEFGHLARLLREITEIYGKEIVKNDQVSYYHLVKTEYLFKSTLCKFNSILSTTNDLSVGIIYSSNAPLILNLCKYGEIGCYGFSCDWISDFCNESEYLFTGSHYMEIQSIIHINKAHNYAVYINGIALCID